MFPQFPRGGWQCGSVTWVLHSRRSLVLPTVAKCDPNAMGCVGMGGRTPVDLFGTDHPISATDQFIADPALFVGVITHLEYHPSLQDEYRSRGRGDARLVRHLRADGRSRRGWNLFRDQAGIGGRQRELIGVGPDQSGAGNWRRLLV